MINHVRTLLLREGGPRYPDSFYADAYIPEGANFAELTPAMARVYNTLFLPATTDREKMEIIWLCLLIIDSTCFSDRITMADSRVTYDLSTEIAGTLDTIITTKHIFDTMLGLTEADIIELFSGTESDPSLAEAFNKHPMANVRVAAAILALAYKAQA